MTTSGQTLLSNAAAALDVDDSVRAVATSLYEQAEDRYLHRGRPQDSLQAASLYLACKLEEECPWSARDVADATEDVSKADILDSARAINSTLPIEVPPQSPTMFTERYCDDLDLDDETQKIATTMADALSDRDGTATGLAASAVYAATQLTDERVTQSELSDLAGVSEVTIRNWYPEHITAYETQKESEPSAAE